MKSIIKNILIFLTTVYICSNCVLSEQIKQQTTFRDLSDSILNHKNDNDLLNTMEKLKELLKNPDTIFELEDLYGGVSTIIYSKQAIPMNLGDYNISIITAIDIYLRELDKRIEKNWNYDDERWRALDYHINLQFEGKSVESIKDPIEKKKALDRLSLERNKLAKVNLKFKQQKTFITVRENMLSQIANRVTMDEVGWHKNDVIARFGINEECKEILINHIKRKGM